MNILAVDTSTPYTILAHFHWNNGWGIKDLSVEAVDKNRDNWLDIQAADFTRGFGLDRFDGFAAGSGPGSFTGLRIGFTYLKALAVLWDKHFFSFPTTRMLSHAYLEEGENLLLQLNTTLYATTDPRFCDTPDGIGTLDKWLSVYAENPGRILLWNIYPGKSPLPEGIRVFHPDQKKPRKDFTPDFIPVPDFIEANKKELRSELPRYGFTVELKRKNYA